ncbi:MAG TPA: D-arabinono-1,4-lactone oxidase [Pseudonocardiaceae bacterium]|jgi:xylitol oxidase|nr:D-arabinono-1,4-lactone oxidase [Pseudonocardiaceae bacterium]
MLTSGGPSTNWAGNVTFRAAHVHRPTSVDELRTLVGSSAKIRALGTGHSFNLIADTTADLVRVDGLPATVEIDRHTAIARVAAGLRYAEVAVALERAGFALANLASLPHISVAGSVATGTHGSGDTQRGLASAVAALTLIAPDGTQVEVHRDTDPGAIVALGALGIVTALTLDIEPTFQVAQHVYRNVPLAEIAASFDAVYGSAYSVSAFTTWHSGDATVWQKRRVDAPEPAWTGAHPATETVNPVPGMAAANATAQLGVPGPWHERLPHFRPEFTPSAGKELQSEFFLPRASAPEAIAALREIGELIASVVQVSEIRVVRADDLWLSPAYHRDSVTFHFTWIEDALAVAPVLAQVEQRLVPLGARPHWGKLTSIPAADIAANYPCANDFAALLRRFDPDGKFRNSYVDDLFPVS